MTTNKIIKPRGRPKSFDRSKAIDCALQLFWERGYDSVGVAELGEAIGIKPPSLYQAFGSKHGLFVEAVRRYEETGGGFMPEVLERSESLGEYVENILIGATDLYTDNGRSLGCLVLDSTLNSSDQSARATTAKKRAETRDYLKRCLQSFGSDEAGELADWMMIAMTGLSGAARNGHSPKQLRKFAKKVARCA